MLRVARSKVALDVLLVQCRGGVGRVAGHEARKRAEADVRRGNEMLKTRVAERTQELEVAYRSLLETQQAGNAAGAAALPGAVGPQRRTRYQQCADTGHPPHPVAARS